MKEDRDYVLEVVEKMFENIELPEESAVKRYNMYEEFESAFYNDLYGMEEEIQDKLIKEGKEGEVFCKSLYENISTIRERAIEELECKIRGCCYEVRCEEDEMYIKGI